MKINVSVKAQIFLWLCAAFMVTGCKTSKPDKNSAEVVIASTSAQRVMTEARTFFVERGYKVKSSVPPELVLQKPFEKARELAGVSDACLRISLVMSKRAAAQYTLAGTPFVVRGCGGSLESVAVEPSGFAQLQEHLQAIKSVVESH